MKKVLLILMAALLLSAPAIDSVQAMAFPIGTKGWFFDFGMTVPLFKVIQSEKGSAASADAVPMLGIGGGLQTYWGLIGDAENQKVISINFPTLAISVRDTDEKKMDLSLIADVGFFDNKIRLGAGYEFGKLEYARSRFMGVFSIGVGF